MEEALLEISLEASSNGLLLDISPGGREPGPAKSAIYISTFNQGEMHSKRTKLKHKYICNTKRTIVIFCCAYNTNVHKLNKHNRK
jgi:hypothetical protein